MGTRQPVTAKAPPGTQQAVTARLIGGPTTRRGLAVLAPGESTIFRPAPHLPGAPGIAPAAPQKRRKERP